MPQPCSSPAAALAERPHPERRRRGHDADHPRLAEHHPRLVTTRLVEGRTCTSCGHEHLERHHQRYSIGLCSESDLHSVCRTRRRSSQIRDLSKQAQITRTRSWRADRTDRVPTRFRVGPLHGPSRRLCRMASRWIHGIGHQPSTR